MKITLENAPLLYSMEEAAALLKISSKTLWKLCEAGKAPCVRLGARRLIAFSWLADQGIELPQYDTGLIDCREASRLLGISPRHLFRFTASGEIPSRRLGDRGVRYSVAELRVWVDVNSRFVEPQNEEGTTP
jgi:excisionase family DNA binding protein